MGSDRTGAADLRLVDHPLCDDVAIILAHVTPPFPALLGMTSAEIAATYVEGASLAEIGTDQGISPDVMLVALIDVWEHAYSLAVLAGDRDEGDGAAGDSGDAETHPKVYRLLRHHQGELPRPVDAIGVF